MYTKFYLNRYVQKSENQPAEGGNGVSRLPLPKRRKDAFLRHPYGISALNKVSCVLFWPSLSSQSLIDDSKHNPLVHQEVLRYLEHYCLHFNLDKFIRFGTLVELVEPIQESGVEKWRVTSRENGALVRFSVCYFLWSCKSSSTAQCAGQPSLSFDLYF